MTGVTLTQTQYGPVGLFTPPAKSAGRVHSYHKGNGTVGSRPALVPGLSTRFSLTQTSSQYAGPPGCERHGQPVEHHAGRLHKLW